MPVLLPGTSDSVIPVFLRQFNWGDFRGSGPEEMSALLLFGRNPQATDSLPPCRPIFRGEDDPFPFLPNAVRWTSLKVLNVGCRRVALAVFDDVDGLRLTRGAASLERRDREHRRDNAPVGERPFCRVSPFPRGRESQHGPAVLVGDATVVSP